MIFLNLRSHYGSICSPSPVFPSCSDSPGTARGLVRLKAHRLLTMPIRPACSGPSLHFWPRDGLAVLLTSRPRHELSPAREGLGASPAPQHVQSWGCAGPGPAPLPFLTQGLLFTRVCPISSVLWDTRNLASLLSWGPAWFSHPLDCWLRECHVHLPRAPCPGALAQRLPGSSRTCRMDMTFSVGWRPCACTEV